MSTPKESRKPTTGDVTKAPQAPRAKGSGKAAATPAKPPADATHPDPTRYGDWEKKGRCIDF